MSQFLEIFPANTYRSLPQRPPIFHAARRMCVNLRPQDVDCQTLGTLESSHGYPVASCVRLRRTISFLCNGAAVVTCHGRAVATFQDTFAPSVHRRYMPYVDAHAQSGIKGELRVCDLTWLDLLYPRPAAEAGPWGS